MPMLPYHLSACWTEQVWTPLGLCDRSYHHCLDGCFVGVTGYCRLPSQAHLSCISLFPSSQLLCLLYVCLHVSSVRRFLALGTLQASHTEQAGPQSRVVTAGFWLPGSVAEVQPSLMMAVAIFLHFILLQVHQTLSLDLRQVLNAIIFRNKKPVLLLGTFSLLRGLNWEQLLKQFCRQEGRSGDCGMGRYRCW